jgi:(4S)-4-hydroxy-5-phosphonooxypentane-2,3-dione isomerase
MSKITFIARMTVQPGKEREFEDCCLQLQRYVQGNEPDTLYYEFFKLREPRRYAVIESFRNEDAEHRHMASKVLADLAPRISACLDGTWVREYFDPM